MTTGATAGKKPPLISFAVPVERKREIERRAAEFGARQGRPASVSDYVRAALDHFDEVQEAA
jgi:hypothetical protein